MAVRFLVSTGLLVFKFHRCYVYYLVLLRLRLFLVNFFCSVLVARSQRVRVTPYVEYITYTPGPWEDPVNEATTLTVEIESHTIPCISMHTYLYYILLYEYISFFLTSNYSLPFQHAYFFLSVAVS